jgi:hypothetical protein
MVLGKVLFLVHVPLFCCSGSDFAALDTLRPLERIRLALKSGLLRPVASCFTSGSSVTVSPSPVSLLKSVNSRNAYVSLGVRNIEKSPFLLATSRMGNRC